jgi:hypothetical protein
VTGEGVRRERDRALAAVRSFLEQGPGHATYQGR